MFSEAERVLTSYCCHSCWNACSGAYYTAGNEQNLSRQRDCLQNKAWYWLLGKDQRVHYAKTFKSSTDRKCTNIKSSCIKAFPIKPVRCAQCTLQCDHQMKIHCEWSSDGCLIKWPNVSYDRSSFILYWGLNSDTSVLVFSWTKVTASEIHGWAAHLSTTSTGLIRINHIPYDMEYKKKI